MSLFQRLDEAQLRPAKFVKNWNDPIPRMELALSVRESYTGTMQKPYLNFGAGLYQGVWAEEGNAQKEIWTCFAPMISHESEKHKKFIDMILEDVWNHHLVGRTLRIAIGKHVNLDTHYNVKISELPSAFRYESHIDVDMEAIRKLGDSKGKDVLLTMFYNLLGYNKYGNELKSIIFKEEEEWIKLNTDRTALQELTRHPVPSGSIDSTLLKTLETPQMKPQDAET